jgi:hypothetical protein
MPSSNLIKLAPTLSAEEKFKIVVADVHKSMAGEQPILSESERRAIIMCESREAWEEYTRHISMMQWAGAFWSREIEMEKLRTYATALNLKNELSGYIAEIHGSMPEAMRRIRCAYIEEWVELLERAAAGFYAYLEAVTQFEEKMYGVRLFNEDQRGVIESYRVAVDEMIENHNWKIRAFCEGKSKKLNEHIKPIAENMKSYIAKKPIPEQAAVDKIIAEVMGIVDSEMEMLAN